MNDMLGIPTNAPTTGPAAIIAWALIGAALIIFAGRALFPTGNERIYFRRAQDNQAIAILQKQVQSCEAKIEALELQVAAQAREEEYNREYRHSLANQATALGARADLDDSIFTTIFELWPECPELIRKQVAQLRTAKQIRDDYPVPRPPLHEGVMIG